MARKTKKPAQPSRKTSSRFTDPRTKEDFQVRHWPLCNGKEAPPPGSIDPHERRCIEFLAAYYEVNCRHAEHQEALATDAPKSEIDNRLAAIAAALEAVDSLEDRYITIGFYGDPVMDGVRYRDIQFEHPAAPTVQTETRSVSLRVAVPGLEEIPASELVGEPQVVRFENGKVDL